MATEAEEAIYQKVRDEHAREERESRRDLARKIIEEGGDLDHVATQLIISAGELETRSGDPVEEGKRIDRLADTLSAHVINLRKWLDDPERLPL